MQRFYKVLSDLKSEVETVIKEGRRRAEEQPELTPKIDALKELYNKLGSEVTNAKARLEASVELSRALEQDLEDLTAWAEELDSRVDSHSDEIEVLKVSFF